MNRRCLVFFLSSALLSAQPIISTLVGTDWIFPGDRKAAVNAPLGRATATTLDPEGRVVFADQNNHMVMRLERDGTIRVIAGNGLATYSGDGEAAANASLWSPTGVVYDRQGNLYIADTFNHRVRRVTPDGTIATIAGTGNCGFGGDNGPATSAVLCVPYSLAVDGAGNLFINDRVNRRIRRINAAGTITTIAGNGGQTVTLSPSIIATQTAIGSVESIALDAQGNLLIAEFGVNAVRQWSSSGNLTLLARLDSPAGVASDRDGTVWVSSLASHRIGRIRNGAFEPVIGSGAPAFRDGNSNTASFFSPSGFVFDASGAMIIADRENFRIRKVVIGENTTTLAGNGLFQSYPDGTASLGAFLNSPFGVGIDAASLLIADNANARVRRATSSQVSTVSGNGTRAVGSNGVPATQTSAVGPTSVVADRDGNIYYSDTTTDVSPGHVIRRVTRSGQVSNFAGTGAIGLGGEGTAPAATPLAMPWQLAFDSQGRLFLAEAGANRIRIIENGQIRTFAGPADGSQGPAADNVSASAARFRGPLGVAVDASGNVYIADTENRVVRRVTNGTVTIVAGGGTRRIQPGQSAQAREVQLDQPAQLAIDDTGNLFFVDRTQHVVYRLSGGLISIVAGSGRQGFAGDGAFATQALLNTPNGVAVDGRGNVLIADTGNNRIRVIQPVAPTFTASPATLSFTAKSTGIAPVPAAITLGGSLSGMRFSTSVQMDRGAGWVSLTAPDGVMPAELEVRVDPARLSAGTYNATITVTSPGASPATRTVAVRLIVEAEEPPRLSVEETRIEFPVKAGDPPATGSIAVRNRGGGSMNFEISTSTDDGGNWLSASATLASIRANENASIQVSADPSSLAPNTYSGTVTIRAGDMTKSVPVSLAVAEAPRPRMLITHPSLRFTASAGGGAPLPQVFGIFNAGEGNLAYRVNVELLSGENWLQLQNESGSVSASGPSAQVTVNADPSALAPGQYNALLRVVDPQGRAPNSPQNIAVYFTVLGPGQIPAPDIAPTALVFTGLPGSKPGSRTVQVANLGLDDLDFTTARNLPAGEDWLTVAPGTGRLARGEQGRIVVQPDFSNLSAGVYRANINVRFSDGTLRTLSVLSIVGSQEAGKAEREQTTCTLQTTVEGPRTEESPGSAITLRINSRPVNCSGSYSSDVKALFSNGDPPVKLRDNGGFVFTGSWTPVNRNVSSVQVTFQVYLIVGNRLGIEDKLHTVRFATTPPPPAPPVRTAVVDSATYQEIPLVAPGSLVTIFGVELAANTQEVTDLQNLPVELAGTRVELQGKRLALRYVSPGQINAVIPFGLTPDDLQSLVVIRETTPSVPEELAVAKTRPGIFIPDTSKPLQGSILKAADGSLISPENPIRAGEEIIIICNGLGAVDQPVVAGTPPPNAPPASAIVIPMLLINGVEVPVKSAILSPSGGGGYEIRAVVPNDTPTGDSIQVRIRAAGQTSPYVNLSVR